MTESGSENNEDDSEYYDKNEDECANEMNATGAEAHHQWAYTQRPRRQSSHIVLPSTFQHYGSFYLRMGAVGKLN